MAPTSLRTRDFSNLTPRQFDLFTEHNRGHPSAVQVEITPQQADLLLKRNTHNRNVRKPHVDQLVSDMREGRYQFNGDAIRFDRNGVLLDGQHRLMAIVISRTTQPMLLVTGLDPETMKTIDSGVKRTMGDRFMLDGVKNGNNVAATLNLIAGLARGAPKSSLSPQQAFTGLEKHPDLPNSITACHGIRIAPSSVISGIHYIGHQTGYGEEADHFLNVFKTGRTDRDNDPVHVVREKLISQKTGIVREMARNENLALLLSAWENCRSHRQISVIKPRKGDKRFAVHGWNERKMWGS